MKPGSAARQKGHKHQAETPQPSRNRRTGLLEQDYMAYFRPSIQTAWRRE